MEDASGHYPTTVATRTMLLARKAAPRPALPDPAPGWRPARGADLGPSGRAGPPGRRLVAATGPGARQQHRDHLQELRPLDHCRPGHLDGRPHLRPAVPRSEEHTSELQSRENPVCRLPLEKKTTS